MEAQKVVEARIGGGAGAAGDLPARAAAVAAVAAQHALAVDSASRFPSEAFAAVKAQRLLGIQVSKALGGEGASIADVADVCFQLGQA
jgi:acyl-CoA dehydrogenase